MLIITKLYRTHCYYCYTHNRDLLQIMDTEYLRIKFHWGKSSTGTKHGAFIIFLGSHGHPILLIALYVYCHPGKVTLTPVIGVYNGTWTHTAHMTDT